MPAPAHAKLEQVEMVAEFADIHAFVEDHREQTGRAGQPCWQAIGKCWMADSFHRIERLKTLCYFECRGFMRLHARWKSTHAANKQPRIKW